MAISIKVSLVPLVFVVLSATSAYAQSNSDPFTCGPHLLTFAVEPADKRQGMGVRCVKLINEQQGRIHMIWYGEGKWDGKSYRHLGFAAKGTGAGKIILKGRAADFYGNGEDIVSLATDLTLVPNRLDDQMSEIVVTGTWNEIWRRTNTVNYKPLARPRACGPYLASYRTKYLTADGHGFGMRCVSFHSAFFGINAMIWFGNGQENDVPYSHLGLIELRNETSPFPLPPILRPPQPEKEWDAQDIGEASSICHISFGLTCKSFPAGSFHLRRTVTTTSSTIRIGKAWDEWWNEITDY